MLTQYPLLFDRIERDALQALPAERFELMQTLDLKVQLNYHIELREDRHYYSVPWRLKGTRVQVLLRCAPKGAVREYRLQ